jgi:hypothetical protein
MHSDRSEGWVTMAINGTFSFVYSGAIGLGIGIMSIEDGTITGVDYAGGGYSGKVEEQQDGTARLELELTVPAGVTLVGGTAPLEVEHTRRFAQAIRGDFADGKPLQLDVPPGEVIVMISPAHDSWAAVVLKGFTITVNS